MAGISFHGPVASSGRYNVIGMADGAFILQGTLTLEQIEELVREGQKVLKANGRKVVK